MSKIIGKTIYGKLDFTSAFNTIDKISTDFDSTNIYLQSIGFWAYALTPKQIKNQCYDLMTYDDHNTPHYYRLNDQVHKTMLTYNQGIIPVHLQHINTYDPNNILHVINKTANVLHSPTSTKTYSANAERQYDVGYTTEWLHKIKTTMTPYYVALKQIEAYDPISFMCMTTDDMVDALHSLPIDYETSCYCGDGYVYQGRPQDVYVDHLKWLYGVCKHEGIDVEIIQFVDYDKLDDDDYIDDIIYPLYTADY
ncbi:hypothetical protein ACEUA8_01470 [Aeromonas veronii]